MHKLSLYFLFSLMFLPLMSQTHRVYFMPGFGADERSFQYLKLDSRLEPVYIRYLPIEKKETIEAYARRLAVQIDTTQPFSLVGVSLGGMLAIEMGKFLHPERIVVIASAKTEAEVAPRYHLLRYLPLHQIMGDKVTRVLSPLGRRLFEPEGLPWEPLYRQMIRDKPPHFLKRSVHMISRWKNSEYRSDVIHIHGKKDHTLPLKHIRSCEYVMENGGHMMIITCAEEISRILGEVL
ncbi:MAG: alpha/beta hydrolase [Bacteroidetes bacterium]|nr:MAG: alpha/beta hydrolase [Bacteroidota bacterium]